MKSKPKSTKAAIVDVFTMEDVHAYLDGRLDPDRRAAMQRLLQEDDVAAQRLSAYIDQVAKLHKLFRKTAKNDD